MKTTKQRRVERDKERFQAQFHSAERVEFIRQLPCEVTGFLAGLGFLEEVVNAHTEGGGVGRKGPYTSIVPLRWRVHTDFDEMPENRFEVKYNRSKQSIRDTAPHYHALWLEHVGEDA